MRRILLVQRYCIVYILTNVPGSRRIILDLTASNKVPDTRHPVSQQSKHRHEQGEDDGTIL